MITNARHQSFPSLVALSLTLAGTLMLSACGPAATGGGTGGHTTTGSGGSTVGTGGATVGTGGATGSGGATASGGSTGSGGVTASGGATVGGAGGGGRAGTGGAAGGASGAGGRGGTTGTGGAAGGSAGSSAGGAGGASSCPGHAISLSANGTGNASDAAHARVMVDLGNDLPIGNSNRTLEFWAYVRSTDWVGETNTIYEYGDTAASDPSASGFGLDFGGNAGSIDPYTNGGYDNDNQATGLTTTSNQWVHFAMTWDGTAVRAYVNGVVKSTKTGSGGLVTIKTPLTIGCNNPRFSCFGGYFDEFRVWNVARTATEIMNNYNKTSVGNEPGLVGYWKFDEASGTTVADSVTTAGHTAHPGMIMAVSAAQNPTFVTPNPLPPITCP